MAENPPSKHISYWRQASELLCALCSSGDWQFRVKRLVFHVGFFPSMWNFGQCKPQTLGYSSWLLCWLVLKLHHFRPTVSPSSTSLKAFNGLFLFWKLEQKILGIKHPKYWKRWRNPGIGRFIQGNHKQKPFTALYIYIYTQEKDQPRNDKKLSMVFWGLVDLEAHPSLAWAKMTGPLGWAEMWFSMVKMVGIPGWLGWLAWLLWFRWFCFGWVGFVGYKSV